MSEEPNLELLLEMEDLVHDANQETGDIVDRLPSFQDRLGGDVDEVWKGDELVLTWTSRKGVTNEVVRYNKGEGVLTILSPKDHGSITSIEIELPEWDYVQHTIDSELYGGHLQINGLPRGFNKVYGWGLGIHRRYRGILGHLKKRADFSILRLVRDGEEGLDGDDLRYRIRLDRFDLFRAAIDRTRSRVTTVVARVGDAEAHNAVADLFGIQRIFPSPGRLPEVQALTEAIVTGVTTAQDRAVLAAGIVQVAPALGRESPERLSQLRHDIDLVSLETLIERFESALKKGRNLKDESYWQGFFNSNRFILQQLFAAPIVVRKDGANVGDADVDRKGARVTDFLCVNTITKTGVVVEIKTPGTSLVEDRPYRGIKGHPAAVYAPHRGLSGAVAQVLAQKESAVTDIGDKRHTQGIDLSRDLHCAVIVGRVGKIKNEGQRTSFLRYRSGLQGVTVIGFDEVLEQLRALHTVLQSGGDVIVLPDVTTG